MIPIRKQKSWQPRKNKYEKTIYPPGNGAPVIYEATQQKVTTDGRLEVIFVRVPARGQRMQPVEKVHFQQKNLRT